MYVIDAHFKRISLVTLNDIADHFGVYVLWSGKSIVRPSYIGEGNLWDRLGSHIKSPEKTGSVLDGAIAVFEGTPKTSKEEAEIVKVLLLRVMELTDRFPTQNIGGGKSGKVVKTWIGKGKIRVNCTGVDPLLDPNRPAMVDKKTIECDLDLNDSKWILKHNWKRRSS